MSLREGDRVRVQKGVPLRGYHNHECLTGVVTREANRHLGLGVIVTMDEPNRAGSRIAGPFYTGELEEIPCRGKGTAGVSAADD